jgi:hypothetical protein
VKWTLGVEDHLRITEGEAPMPDSEDDGISDYVAACPITPELAQQIAGLAELSWDDPDVTDPAMRSLGWHEDEVPLDPGRFVTGQGHIVYGDTCFAMPFSQYYWVGGEVWQDDFWGSLRGWSSQKDAGRKEFDAHVSAAVDRFAERLGPPDHDVRAKGSTVSTGPYSWRYAAWRRGGNVLVVGQSLEGFSYSQFEEALVYIGALAEDAPFPETSKFADFITW